MPENHTTIRNVSMRGSTAVIPVAIIRVALKGDAVHPAGDMSALAVVRSYVAPSAVTSPMGSTAHGHTGHSDIGLKS
jgi:hypothetical protein